MRCRWGDVLGGISSRLIVPIGGSTLPIMVHVSESVPEADSEP